MLKAYKLTFAGDSGLGFNVKGNVLVIANNLKDARKFAKEQGFTIVRNTERTEWFRVKEGLCMVLE
ncbi:MAG TPA: hypothetical protein P5323_02590 [Candidatus Moranbacteria bacterium]|nr:hypothetical protein [Candidatus Moranbacteria bacterium]HSA08184.1 hypothetical protein [Candidatus Moranbacteria bacterium]